MQSTDSEPAKGPHPHTPRLAAQLAMERTVLFTDAVFAIVITLLALDVRLPEHAAITNQDELLHALADALPKLLAYAVSFSVCALFWTAHLRRFGHVAALDRLAIWLNLAGLAFIGLVPFTTSVLSHHLSAVAVRVYAGNLVAVSLFNLLLWWHVSRTPALFGPTLTPALRREESRRAVLSVAVFAASIPIASLNPVWAMLSWALLWPGAALLRRRSRRALAPAERR